MEGSDRLEFRDVEALSYRRLSLVCRVGSTLVAVPPRRILPGSQVRRRGDRGKLVLPKEVAVWASPGYAELCITGAMPRSGLCGVAWAERADAGDPGAGDSA